MPLVRDDSIMLGFGFRFTSVYSGRLWTPAADRLCERFHGIETDPDDCLIHLLFDEDGSTKENHDRRTGLRRGAKRYAKSLIVFNEWWGTSQEDLVPLVWQAISEAKHYGVRVDLDAPTYHREDWDRYRLPSPALRLGGDLPKSTDFTTWDEAIAGVYDMRDDSAITFDSAPETGKEKVHLVDDDPVHSQLSKLALQRVVRSIRAQEPHAPLELVRHAVSFHIKTGDYLNLDIERGGNGSQGTVPRHLPEPR